MKMTSATNVTRCAQCDTSLEWDAAVGCYRAIDPFTPGNDRSTHCVDGHSDYHPHQP